MYEDVGDIISLMPNQRNNVKILGFETMSVAQETRKFIAYGTFTRPLRIA